MTITDASSLSAKRTQLTRRIWGRDTIDTSETSLTDTEITSSTVPESRPIQPVPSAVTVRKYAMDLPTSGGTRIYARADHYIRNWEPVDKLVILNPGHMATYDGDEAVPNSMEQVIRHLLDDGYDVLATYMLCGTPEQARVIENCHVRPFTEAALRPSEGHPLRYFFDSIRRSLNYVTRLGSGFDYTEIHMAGLSGGGWTTVWFAALDTRVKISVQVAGSQPLDELTPAARDRVDDWEQVYHPIYNDLYGIATYHDLYVMASHGSGRRHIQVLNRRDDCCFSPATTAVHPIEDWDDRARADEREVRAKLFELGSGSFRLEIDEAASRHEISRNTMVTVILGELNGSNAAVGGRTGVDVFARGMNGNMWHHNGSGWYDTNIAIVGKPAVVTGAFSGHALDVIYRTPFNGLGHAFLDGTWRAVRLAGSVITDPTALSWGPGRIDVVALGRDYAPYHWNTTGPDSWSGFRRVSDAKGVGPVSLASWGPGRLDMFYRGHHRGVYHIRSSGDAPYTLQDVGGIIKSYPAAIASPSDHTLRVYGAGRSEGLWEAMLPEAGSWSSWQNLSSLTSALDTRTRATPAAVRLASGSIRVFTTTATENLGVFELAGGRWTFTRLGGSSLVGSPTALTSGGAYTRVSDGSAWLRESGAWQPRGGYLER